jgi:hypothetical protein
MIGVMEELKLIQFFLQGGLVVFVLVFCVYIRKMDASSVQEREQRESIRIAERQAAEDEKWQKIFDQNRIDRIADREALMTSLELGHSQSLLLRELTVEIRALSKTTESVNTKLDRK